MPERTADETATAALDAGGGAVAGELDGRREEAGERGGGGCIFSTETNTDC